MSFDCKILKTKEYYLNEIIELVSKMVPDLNVGKINELLELKRSDVNADIESIRMILDMLAKKAETRGTQTEFLKDVEYAFYLLTLKSYKIKREIEVSEMLDDLEKDLAKNVV